MMEDLRTRLNSLECFMKLETPLQSISQLVELLEENRFNSQTYSKKLKEEKLTEVE